MSSQRVPGGVVHKLPADLRKVLIANTTALDAWSAGRGASTASAPAGSAPD